MDVTIFSDGSVLKPNPGGPGGCAAVVLKGVIPATARVDDALIVAVRVGQEDASTNQRMELTGALIGLLAALEVGATTAHLVSDSEYVIKGLREWVHNWVKLGWRTKSGTQVANLELWQALYEVAHRRGLKVVPTHVRGHRGYPWNEHVDVLAGEQSAEVKRRLRGG